jgi:RNA polymerase sigma-70 factor (ECF subfamily)
VESSTSIARVPRRVRFEELAVPWMKSLYNAALRLTRDRHAAEDVVQETVLRAYRTFDGFVEGTNVKAWLFTILHSVLVNRHHKERREPESLSSEAASRALEQLADTGISGVIASPAGAEIEAALAALPEQFRAAVLLVDLHDLTYEEAAAALGCKVGTIRSRLHRARALLFSTLADHARRLGYLPRRPERIT